MNYKKFKHKITQDIIILENNSHGAHIAFLGDQIIPRRFIENSNDWEEIIEKDYEILSFRYKNSNRIFHKTTNDITKAYVCNGSGYIAYESINNESVYKIFDIYSIKRLSDGKIFTIGDDIFIRTGTEYIIKSFTLQHNSVIIWLDSTRWLDLKQLRHSKKPLFTTEDGVDIFEESDCWVVTPQHYRLYKWSRTTRTIIDGEKYFSTKQAAEDYIIMNKPYLSIQELIDDEITYPFHMENLKKLVKSKLNL